MDPVWLVWTAACLPVEEDVVNRWRVIWLRFFWRRSDRNKGVCCILCGHYHDASMFLSEWQQLDLQLGCCSEPRWERRCGSYRVWLKQGALTGHPGTPARGTHGHHWCHVYLSYERWRSFAVLSSHPPTFTCRSLSLRSASLEAALVTRGRVIPMTRGGASHYTRPPLSRCGGCTLVSPTLSSPISPDPVASWCTIFASAAPLPGQDWGWSWRDGRG